MAPHLSKAEGESKTGAGDCGKELGVGYGLRGTYLRREGVSVSLV